MREVSDGYNVCKMMKSLSLVPQHSTHGKQSHTVRVKFSKWVNLMLSILTAIIKKGSILNGH